MAALAARILAAALLERDDLWTAGLLDDLAGDGRTGNNRSANLDAGIATDRRSNVLADTVKYQTSREKLFSCGDMRRGQSLVVWAIREGRQCARSMDEWLMGKTDLPR